MSRRNGAGNALAAAQEALGETAEQLKVLTARRREVLLAGTDDDVAVVDAEIEAAQRQQRTRSDRVSVLIEAAEQEAVARRAKEHAVGRVEAKLAERDRIAAELASHVAGADAALLKLFAVNRQILAAWPWQNGSFGAALLGDGAVVGALSNEIFRVGGRPPTTGGAPGDPRGPNYPGEVRESFVDRDARALQPADGREIRRGPCRRLGDHEDRSERSRSRSRDGRRGSSGYERPRNSAGRAAHAELAEPPAGCPAKDGTGDACVARKTKRAGQWAHGSR